MLCIVPKKQCSICKLTRELVEEFKEKKVDLDYLAERIKFEFKQIYLTSSRISVCIECSTKAKVLRTIENFD